MLDQKCVQSNISLIAPFLKIWGYDHANTFSFENT